MTEDVELAGVKLESDSDFDDETVNLLNGMDEAGATTTIKPAAMNEGNSKENKQFEHDPRCPNHPAQMAEKERNRKRRGCCRDLRKRPRFVLALRLVTGPLIVVCVALLLYPAPNLFSEHSLTAAALLWGGIEPLKELMHLGIWSRACGTFEKNRNALCFAMLRWGLWFQAPYFASVAIVSGFALITHDSLFSHLHHSRTLLSSLSSSSNVSDHDLNGLKMASLLESSYAVPIVELVFLVQFLFTSYLCGACIYGILHLRNDRVKPWFERHFDSLRRALSSKQAQKISDESSNLAYSTTMQAVLTRMARMTVQLFVNVTPLSMESNKKSNDGNNNTKFKKVSSHLRVSQFPFALCLSWLVQVHWLWFILYTLVAIKVRISDEGSTVSLGGIASMMSQFGEQLVSGMGMSFHYAFANSMVHTVVFNPHNANKIDCARCLIFWMGTLDLIFVIHSIWRMMMMMNQSNEDNNHHQNSDNNHMVSVDKVSFILVTVHLVIFAAIWLCLSGLKQISKRVKLHSGSSNAECMRLRPSLLSVAESSPDHKFGALGVHYCSVLMFLTMLLSSMVVAVVLVGMHEVPLYLRWRHFDALVMYALHFSILTIHNTVSLVQFAAGFVFSLRFIRGSAIAFMIATIAHNSQIIWNYYSHSHSHSDPSPLLSVHWSEYVLFGLNCVLFAVCWTLRYMTYYLNDICSVPSVRDKGSLHYDHDLKPGDEHANINGTNIVPLKNLNNFRSLQLYGCALFIYIWVQCFLLRSDSMSRSEMTSILRWKCPNELGRASSMKSCSSAVTTSGVKYYDLAFHLGFLGVLFIYDALITRRWAPALDFTKLCAVSNGGLFATWLIAWIIGFDHIRGTQHQTAITVALCCGLLNVFVAMLIGYQALQKHHWYHSKPTFVTY